MVELKIGDNIIKIDDKKKKIDPKKIPKRLLIKLITNIDRYKRVTLKQNMIVANPPGDNFLFFMKYYKLKKGVFDELGYSKSNRPLLFCSRNNILRTAVKKNKKDNEEYIMHNIHFIINELFENGNKLYLGSEPYTIFTNYWNGLIYKTNNPNVLQIDIRVTLAQGIKISSAQSFQLTCDQRKKEIGEDVDLVFNNIVNSIKTLGETKKQKNDSRQIYKISSHETPVALAEIVRKYQQFT